MNIPAHGTAYWPDPMNPSWGRKYLAWHKEKGTGTVLVSESQDVGSVQDVLDFAASHTDCGIDAVEGPYYESGHHVEISGYRPARDDELVRIQTYLKQESRLAAERKAQDIEKAKKLLRDAGEL